MCMTVCLHVIAPYVCTACSGQQRAPEPLELECVGLLPYLSSVHLVMGVKRLDWRVVVPWGISGDEAKVS